MRGGLSERWLLAEETGCEYIEVPGTLIKNKTEEILTSLEIGDFLTEKEISLLYDQDEEIPERVKYVLHTEPSLSKSNRFGRKIQPPIKWYHRKWTTRYIDMIIMMSHYLNSPASVIEIHPGYRKNSFEDIALFIGLLLESYHDEFDCVPLILLENRTEQFISRGRDIADYWEYLVSNHPGLVEHTGIVLDVQQLFTRTRGRFFDEFTSIPEECLKAFHIHTRHRWPRLGDEIPWRIVFGMIKELDGNILINPEIHQKNRVSQAIRFCNEMLSS
jgi:hypothetical protein